ncbi:hypothetical protein BJ741DRAFT_599295 [Chytriomyces cf. hyalinus JEL632]|nr:hypothetical protein BJ741DRAFT_599295 [Chytriomyces cf. hyalinus JEL632]
MNQQRQRRTSSQSLQPSTASNQTTRPIINRHLHQSSFSSSGSLPSNLAFVTGEPSRAHWKPDNAVQYCENCRTRFGLLTRRHHCRTCGGIFCGPCSKYMIRLDQNADPHPAGVTSRICGECHSEFIRRGEREHEAKRIAAMNGVSSGDVDGGDANVSAALASAGLNYSFPVVGSVPTAGRYGGRDLIGDQMDLNQEPLGSENRQGDDSDHDGESEEDDEVGELEKPGRAFASVRKQSTVEEPIVAQSVPTDWSWSTF